MYYLYKKKKPGEDGDSSSSATGRITSTASTVTPVTVHSSVEEHRQHHYMHNQYDQPSLQYQSSEVNPGRGDSHHSQDQQLDGSSSESKQESKQKEDPSTRLLLKRRGLEEKNDFSEGVMQPRRPSRTACERCQRDITKNGGLHRIICNDQDKHMFCKSCVIQFVDDWVSGRAPDCELRQGKLGGARGLYALPCLHPNCRKGCLVEAHLQPLLSHQLFVDYRQKIMRVRAERTRSKSLHEALSGTAQPPAPARRRSQQEEQHLLLSSSSAHSSLPDPHQHHRHLYQDQYQDHSLYQDQPMVRHSFPQQQQHPHEQLQLMHRHSYSHHPQQQQMEQEFHMLQGQQLQQEQQMQLQQRYSQLQRQQQQMQLQLQDQGQHQLQMQQFQQRRQQEEAAAAGAAPPSQYGHGQHGGVVHSMPPPALLRRDSTASSARSSQTSRRTNKSVRFSIAGQTYEDEGEHQEEDDDNSSATSQSSLTTRFPVSVDGQTEHEEHVYRGHAQQVQHRHHQQEQQQHPQQTQVQAQACQQLQGYPTSNNSTVCQCCYEEIDARRSNLMTSCNPRHPNSQAHRFCETCFRLYIQEWLFGQATYMLRPGPQDSSGRTELVLPCLYGECAEGGFSDDRVSQVIPVRMFQLYQQKIDPLRRQKEDDDEKLLKMAIRLSLEEGQKHKQVQRLQEEQRSIAQDGARPINRSAAFYGSRLPASVHVPPPPALSEASSLTSFNQSVFGAGSPGGSPGERQKAQQAVQELQRTKIEKSIHKVEEALTAAKIRQCPVCMTKFLKDKDFCNKLKCPSCQTAICYICRNITPAQGYEHFCTHKHGGCGTCIGERCALWTTVEEDDRRDLADMRARGLDEANRIWEESLLQQRAKDREIKVDVEQLLQAPPPPHDPHARR